MIMSDNFDLIRCMGDVMGDQYADNKQIQENLAGCQKEAAAIQAELDRAVQNFGQGMQRGMESCQRQVQQAMQSGSITEQGLKLKNFMY